MNKNSAVHKNSELVLGGINWGYCSQDAKNLINYSNKKIIYNIYLTTSHMCHSETNSPINVVIHGSIHTSENIVIFPNGIKKGQVLKKTLKLSDLGVIIGVKVSN